MEQDKRQRGREFGRGIAAALAVILVIAVVLQLTGVVDWKMAVAGGGNAATEGIFSEKVQKKAKEIRRYIDQYYLDDVSEETMDDAIYSGMMAGLDDPYAAYYNEKDYAALKEDTSGNYCGIGAYVSQNASTGTITIIKPIKDGPAEKAGIKAGDIIYTVDDEEVTGEDLTKVVTKMKGEPGTKVKIKVARSGESDYLEFTLTRAQIETPSVDYAMLDEQVGYVTVSAFEETTTEQFVKAVNALEKQGEKGLIIDLRNNGGGLLKTSVEMLDRILPKNQLVVYTRDKNEKGDSYYTTDDEEVTVPIVVLVNGNSASASEIFAGALQDYKKAQLVGQKTFGKGIVQTIYNLSDGTALKLTTAKYYTPEGRNIHGTGLEPDVTVELKDKTTTQKKSKVVIDSQLQKAIDVLTK